MEWTMQCVLPRSLDVVATCIPPHHHEKQCVTVGMAMARSLTTIANVE